MGLPLKLIFDVSKLTATSLGSYGIISFDWINSEWFVGNLKFAGFISYASIPVYQSLLMLGIRFMFPIFSMIYGIVSYSLS